MYFNDEVETSRWQNPLYLHLFPEKQPAKGNARCVFGTVSYLHDTPWDKNVKKMFYKHCIASVCESHTLHWQETAVWNLVQTLSHWHLLTPNSTATSVTIWFSIWPARPMSCKLSGVLSAICLLPLFASQHGGIQYVCVVTQAALQWLRGS